MRRNAILTFAALSSVACGTADGGTSASSYSSGHHAHGKPTEPASGFRADAAALGWFTPLENAPRPLVTPTYDGSGQTVEPTVLLFRDGWRGHHYWMAVSPYPFGNEKCENPSILVSEDGRSWDVPAGLSNPLATPGSGDLADATLVYDDASDQLWVYYLAEVRDPQRGRLEALHRMTSTDGIHWLPSPPVLEGTPYHMESPSVVKLAGEFHMWTVDIGPGGCSTSSSRVMERTSSDGLQWSQPTAIDVDVPGQVIWHLNVTQVPGAQRILAAITAFDAHTSCHATKLFLAYGDTRGMAMVPEPLLGPGRAPAWDDAAIYRSSMLYDSKQGRLRAWYSARNSASNAWHVGYAEGALTVPQ